MKKAMKKLGMVMALLAMIVTVVPTQVRAADNNTVTIHKYAGDAWNSTTYPNDGTEITNVPSGVQALQNVEFKITKMSDDTTTVSGGTVDNTFTVKTGKTNASGVLSFTSLPDGIYKVEETAHSAIATNGAMSPFILKLPMTNPAGTGFMTTVHVYPKNQIKDGPDIDKTVDTSGSDTILDNITYTLNIDIPDDIATAIKYNVIDTLDARLNLVTSSVVVQIVNGTTTTVPASEYTNSSTVNKLNLSLKDSAKVKAAAGKKLKITFKAKILSGAKDTTTAIPNEAEVDYTNSFNVEQDNTSNKVYTTVANIVIDKVKKGSSSLKLPGAKFKLYTDAACTTAVQEPGTSNDYEVTTDSLGAASFKGIIAGTYYVKETKAPDGYQLLTSAIKVTLNPVTGTTIVTHASITVENASNEGFKLPLTGGTGTLMFTVGGVALIGVAAFLFIKNKKKV